MKSVYCAVRIGSLNKAVCASYLKGWYSWKELRSKGSLLKIYFCCYADGPRNVAVNITRHISSLEIKAAVQSEEVNCTCSKEVITQSFSIFWRIFKKLCRAIREEPSVCDETPCWMLTVPAFRRLILPSSSGSRSVDYLILKSKALRSFDTSATMARRYNVIRETKLGS